MSSDVGCHIWDKLRPIPKHGSILLYVPMETIRLIRTESPGRRAQDGHLDSHTAPELWSFSLFAYQTLYLIITYRYIIQVCIYIKNQHTREFISTWKVPHKQNNGKQVEFMYFVFTRMPGESYHRLCCCVCVTSFRRKLYPVCVDSGQLL